jgi:nicotinic acid mononucleotide adenylyltransferase
LIQGKVYMGIAKTVFYDLRRLFAIRTTLDSLELRAPPTTVFLYPPPGSVQLSRVGILCGSFNPFTQAHIVLAQLAREHFHLDQVFFTLAKVTVDKEQVSGMSLEDRLSLLSLFARKNKGLGVALVNRGLYFEQAQAFRSLLGESAEVSFVVGMDKVLQILDPRYYQDRDAALRMLFRLASLIAANRGEMEEAALSSLLAKPENHAYRPYIHFLLLPVEVRDLSASQLRATLAAGGQSGVEVPEEVAAFIAETRVYCPPQLIDGEEVEVYNLRIQLFNLLYAARAWAEKEADFVRLMAIALSPTNKGRTLRALLRNPPAEDLTTQLRSCQG